jgi:hypothetical protein
MFKSEEHAGINQSNYVSVDSFREGNSTQGQEQSNIVDELMK